MLFGKHAFEVVGVDITFLLSVNRLSALVLLTRYEAASRRYERTIIVVVV